MYGRWITSSSTKQSTGERIEKLACRWLKQQGLQLIERNYRCRMGEIDIVMTDQQRLIFVEVKYRRQDSYGAAHETVDWRKQQKLIKAAQYYLLHRPKFNTMACRFDVLAAQPANKGDKLRWHWIQDAFGH